MLIEDVVSLMEPQHIANLKKAFPRFSKRGLCWKELQWSSSRTWKTTRQQKWAVEK